MMKIKETYTVSEVLELLFRIEKQLKCAYTPDEIIDDFCELENYIHKAIAAWNTRADRWIPVSERLPELEPGNTTKTIRVLCTYIRYDVRVVFESVWDEAWEHFYWDYAADYPATFRAPDFTNGNERLIAWQYMPLPALPEEVKG